VFVVSPMIVIVWDFISLAMLVSLPAKDKAGIDNKSIISINLLLIISFTLLFI